MALPGNKKRKLRLLGLIAMGLVVIIMLVRRNFNFDEFEVQIESNLIDEHNRWFDFLRLPKTKPFLQTNAAKSSEFTFNINNFDVLSLQDKFGVIEQLEGPVNPKHFNFLTKVFTNLDVSGPEVKSIDTYKSEERIYHARYNSKDDDSEDNRIVFNEEYLSSFIQLTEEELKLMKKSHANVMKNLPKYSSVPKNMYKGDGIVFVGGGKFNFLTLLSIKSLRDLGSKLPVEVLIPSIDEFEANLCYKVFPNYNAKCILLPHVLQQFSNTENIFQKLQFKGYQYKALALILSNFDRVLFLDSDNTPTRNPDILFKLNPFKDHGLIVWPDFWKRATSPLYYDIANIKVEKNKFLPRYNELLNDYESIDYSKLTNDLIPYHQYKGAIPDPTSESGQLMVDKTTHLNVLVLALYYNLYGPSHYYPLFSQGSDGEGDKETFLASCIALKCKFYQVKTFLKAMGYFNSESKFIGTGMGQYNPINDYNDQAPDLLFIHSNFPKLNPWELRLNGKVFENGERIRLYGNGVKKDIKYDFELLQWQNMKHFMCDLKLKIKVFERVDHNELCIEINDQLSFLKETSHLTDDAY